jgi:hypothetical protein
MVPTIVHNRLFRSNSSALCQNYPEFFASSFRILAISSREGGQFVSHVLQWNTSAPDFSSASNSSWLNLTVWSWSFGQIISNFIRSLMRLLLFSGPLFGCPVFLHPLGLLLALRRGEDPFLPGCGGRNRLCGSSVNSGKRVLRRASQAFRWPLQRFYSPVKSISLLNQ